MADWLVARIRPQLERHVESEIARLGFTAFAPRWQTHSVVNGRQVNTVCSLFPSYLFVLSPIFWYFLRDIRGVFGVVADKDLTPWRSDRLDGFVKWLMKRRNVDGYVPAPPGPPEHKFALGSRVAAVNGMFRGYTGNYGGKSGGRALIELDQLGATLLLKEEDLALIDNNVHTLRFQQPRKSRHRRARRGRPYLQSPTAGAIG